MLGATCNSRFATGGVGRNGDADAQGPLCVPPELVSLHSEAMMRRGGMRGEARRGGSPDMVFRDKVGAAGWRWVVAVIALETRGNVLYR